jgi:TolB-like protein
LVVVFSWIYELTPEGIRKEEQISLDQSIARSTGQRINKAIVALLIIAILTVVVDRLVPETAGTATTDVATTPTSDDGTLDTQKTMAPNAVSDISDKSIAVLPFVNMSGDEENEYFSDGLTEELLNALAKINDLKVTGRTSSFAFKGQNADLRDIGKALNVAHILEGSVRKAKDRVRITAQLIKVDDGYHLWSDTYDRELDDIFAIQEEIASRVVSQLTSTLLGDSEEPLVRMGTANAGAYEAYLRGRHVFERAVDDPQAHADAGRLFDRALELDPGFTLAWYGHFRVLTFRHRGGQIDFSAGVRQIRELADKLIKMDPLLAESHTASGRASLVEMNWAKAEADYREALRLNPGNINSLIGYAGLLWLLDRSSEGLGFAVEALERDPLNLQALRAVATNYSVAGQCEKAKEIVDRALSIEPQLGRVRAILAHCYLYGENNPGRAITYLNDETLSFRRLSGLAIAHDKLGDRAEAQLHLDQLIRSDGEKASYQYAQVYAQWGETERALAALEHAWEIQDTGTVLMKIDPRLDPIRDQPRFITLMEKWENPDKR